MINGDNTKGLPAAGEAGARSDRAVRGGIEQGFGSRALGRIMLADRIFLFRKSFVGLALMLAFAGLALAQGMRTDRRSRLSLEDRAIPAADRTSGPSSLRTYSAPSQPLGNGSARSWVSVDGQGNPTAIGVSFSEDALSGLPAEPRPGQEGTELTLLLPRQAAPFNHIGLDWNPKGHSPAGIYDVPHLDFHFYLITPQQRESIKGVGDDLPRASKPLAAEYLPAGYIMPPGTVVPRMGAHLIDAQSGELHGSAFTRTFLYGSYDGNLIFAEPMITKSFLETKTNVTEFLKLPAKYAVAGYYPTRYSIKYDAATREYTVALEGMVRR
ncbi:MAG TPA: DUF5602 domain-containing protein [Pyrinomonadaceae bacterium]|jgi:hypothetical protein